MKAEKVLISIFMFFVGLCLGVIIFCKHYYNLRQKDALRGSLKYEMKVLYENREVRDSIKIYGDRPYSNKNNRLNYDGSFYVIDSNGSTVLPAKQGYYYQDTVYYKYVPVDTLIVKK